MNKIHNQTSLDIALFHKIDMNLYPLFMSVFEQKSISKAAQVLCISQSAASHALNRLREHLKDDLFVRVGNQMQPTPFAEQIYPNIQYALTNIQSVFSQKQQFEPHMLNTIKIAVHDEIEPIIFPKLVTHFQQIHPHIQVVISKLDRKNMLADLSTQQLDFVFDLEYPSSDKICFAPLVQDQFVVCSQHDEMNKKIYLDCTHIGVSSRRTGLLLEDVYFKHQKISRQILLRCQHYATALHILQQQPNSILTIPKSVLDHLYIAEKLKVFPIPFDLPNMIAGMYWSSEMKLNKRHHFLRNEIHKIFA